MSGEDNAYEYHRELPSSYFDGHLDLFTNEIDSLRAEAKAELNDLDKYVEYIRIAAFDEETGEMLTRQRDD